jgi:type II secretory pathway pseudopilin PulG
MASLHQRRRSAGFTIVEAIRVVAIIGIASVLVLPTLQELIHTSKLRGIARGTTAQMRKARFEAIKRGVPCVVQISPATREVIAFADVHGATLVALPDGIFNPQAGQPPGATDYELERVLLPAGVSFKFQLLSDLASVDGFNNTGNPDPPDDQAIFLSNGSVNDAGAFRFGDQRDNYLEVRIASPATGRVEVLKWSDADAAWHEQGEGGATWKWN